MNKNKYSSLKTLHFTDEDIQKLPIIGTIYYNDGTPVFVPTNKNYENIVEFADYESLKQYDGQKCQLKIVSKQSNILVCEVEESLGMAGDPITENVAIARSFGFKKSFDKSIINEINAIDDVLTEQEIKSRLDLRNKTLFTIDPATCKDMDDAVGIEKIAGGYRVYVAIADVCHYVKPGSLTDKEAYKRGTSCYLGDGVYPMLPERLSNNLCSLNPNVDRPTLCAIVDINENGNITNYDIQKAVICSKHKLSYEEAEDIHLNLNGKEKKYADIKNDIDLMYEASRILENSRANRGAITFDLPEPTYIFNEDRTNVIDIVDKGYLESHKVIESFMVLANEAVAKFMLKNNIACLYRTHEKPSDKKQVKLISVLKQFGINYTGDFSGKSIQKLIDKLENNPRRELILVSILSCLNKAKYQAVNLGHYGLGSLNYLHFTSPIRRYPDKLVHQAIRDYFDHKKNYLPISQLFAKGEYLTNQEISANKAEEKSNRFLNCLYMNNHIGETYKATIIEANHFGYTLKIGMIKVHLNTSNTQKKPGEKIYVKISRIDMANYRIFAEITYHYKKTVENDIEK